MGEDEPLTVEGFLLRVEAKRAVAMAMQEDRQFCREAWLAAGSAVEYALKALIMRRERFNGWPDKATRPDLHTHDLPKLMQLAGIEHAALPHHMRAVWRTVLTWDHFHAYVASPMPRKVARSMVAAAFSEGGVCAWLATQ